MGSPQTERVRRFAWEDTPLGPMEGWSAPLRTAADLVLELPLPAVVHWGPELTALHNESLPALLGSDEDMLGRPFAQVWSGVLDRVQPIVEGALLGEARFMRGYRVPTIRERLPMTAWYDLHFLPLRDENGTVGGVLATAVETTDRVLFEQRQTFLLRLGDRLKALSDPVEMQGEASCLLGEQLKVARVYYGEFEANGKELVIHREYCAPGVVGSLVGRHPFAGHGDRTAEEVRAGRTLVLHDAMTDERLAPAERSLYERFDSRAGIVVPLLDGHRPAVELVVLQPAPRMWTPHEISLVEETAARTRDAVDRGRAERGLSHARGSLEVAVEAAGMGVWDADLVTGTLRTNRRYNEILGYDEGPGTLSSAEVRERVVAEDQDVVDLAFEQAKVTGEFNLEARVRRPDGTVRWIHNRGRVQYDPAGSPVRLAGVTLDVTERKRVEETLRLAKLAAEQASLTKSRFLATMSHELRTPLTGVIGWADLLEDGLLGEVSGRQKHALGRIKASSGYLVSVIEEILTVARMEEGAERVHLDSCDLAALVREVAADFSEQAERKGLTIRVLRAEGSAVVQTDPDKTRRILANLVDNAVKHTREGEVTVELDTSRKDAVAVHVMDTGPGIAAEDRERVFEPFMQGDASYTRAAGGTGLGLSIARGLANLLGGDVTVGARSGGGSIFTFRLASN